MIVTIRHQSYDLLKWRLAVLSVNLMDGNLFILHPFEVIVGDMPLLEEILLELVYNEVILWRFFE